MNKYIFKKSHVELLNQAIGSLKEFNGSYDWLPDGADWGAGGCRILSEALLLLISSENDCHIQVAYLSSRDEQNPLPIPQHVFVRCYLSSYEYYIDYNGVQVRDRFMKNLSLDLMNSKPVIGVYEPLFCDKHEILSNESSVLATYTYLKDYLLKHRV